MSCSRRAFTAALLAAALGPGCGYALAGRGSFLPAYIQSVGIPQLENRTSFFRVEQIITDKIRTEFIGRGKYRVTPEAGGADAVLTGQVASITVQAVGFNDQQLASRYLVTVILSLKFTDARTAEVLWSNDALSVRGEYDLTTRGATLIEAASFSDQEKVAMERISTDVARSAVTAILEAF